MIHIQFSKSRRLIGAIVLLALINTMPTLWAAAWHITHPHGTQIDGVQVQLPWRWIEAPRWVDSQPGVLMKLPYFISFARGTVWTSPGGGARIQDFDITYALQHGNPLIILPPGGTTTCTIVGNHLGSTVRSALILDCSIDKGQRQLRMTGQPDDLPFFLGLAEEISNHNPASSKR